MKLRNATALITGAGRRLGRAIALALAEEGMNLGLHYRSSESAARSLAEEIEKLGGRAHLVHADLEDPEAAPAILAATESHLGPVSVLVNNASAFVGQTLQESSLEDWRRDLALHVESPAVLCKELARRLPDHLEGRIVNLLDWRAEAPDPRYVTYSVAKAGLLALTRNAAAALGPRITVNAVSPGAILPPPGETMPGQALQGLPLERPGTPAEIARATVFLIRDADYTTGAVIPVDGGRHLT